MDKARGNFGLCVFFFFFFFLGGGGGVDGTLALPLKLLAWAGAALLPFPTHMKYPDLSAHSYISYMFTVGILPFLHKRSVILRKLNMIYNCSDQFRKSAGKFLDIHL